METGLGFLLAKNSLINWSRMFSFEEEIPRLN
jgi:hypothetical protein